jgi:hypothetical protein
MSIDELAFLENRTDLEQLEQDLALLSTSQGSDTLPQVQEARRDLEIARAAHIALYFRLCHRSGLERAAAREELLQRIGAGELKIFDPQAAAWRPASQLLIESNQRDEELALREAEHRRLESRLQAAVGTPRNLSGLYELILQLQEVENSGELSPQGSATLVQARQVYEAGQKRQRELTLVIRSGSLQERFQAIAAIRELLANGETQILEASSDMWRAAAQVLDEAGHAYEQESARQAAQVIKKAEELTPNNPRRALQSLYLALDKAIPYTPADRQHIESRYLELLHIYKQPALPAPEDQVQVSPADFEGFKKVREMNRKRLKELFHRSAEWLNHFLNSALTQTPAMLLKEANDPATPVDKSVTLIDMAVTIARKQLSISIEIPEVLVRGGGILFDKGQPERACDLLAQAKPLYTLERTDKVHRHAVTAWLAGCLEYYQGRRLHGYSEWKEARGLFNELLTDARRLKQKDRGDWYKARLSEMDIFAIQTFEEVYFQWMNQVDPISLTGGLAEYRKMMDGQFGRQRINELRQTIQVLLSTGQRELSPEIYWVTLIEASFFEYQLRDYTAAIDHLDEARVGFTHGHRHAVTLWLVGMIRWWLPSQRPQAILNWEESIQEFRFLAEQANKDNRQPLRIWYETQLTLMTTSLRQWVTRTQP